MLSYLFSSVSTASTAQLARIITETLELAPDKLRSPTLDALINQLVTLKPLNGLNSTALNAKVLEAVVLSSTPLAQPKQGTAPSEFRIVLNGSDKQQYEITSKAALAIGTKIQLQLNSNETAVLLKILNRPADKTGQTPQTGITTSANTSSTPASPQTSNNIAARSPQAILAEGARQTLPQQQPLKSLLPLLQQLTTLPEGSVSKAINDQVQTLLKHLATPEQLQQPQQLKQALRNSGVFLESKLAYAAQSKHTEALLKSPALQQDIKTQLQQLSQQVNRTQQNNTTDTNTLATKTDNPVLAAHSKPATISAQAASILATQTSTAGSTNKTDSPLNLAGHEKAVPGLNPAIPTSTVTTTTQTTATSKESGLDIILQQLGRQLLASLARTQLNQLESLAYRAPNTPDNQGPTNSWVLEIPIVHGQNVDNLELRIDQQERTDQEENKKQKQWTVMLAFDLHTLGKMSVQLKIVSQSVEATVWSQLERTHNEVQQHIDTLQTGLEKIGVTVERVACYHGLPAKDAPQIHQQLVDLHT